MLVRVVAGAGRRSWGLIPVGAVAGGFIAHEIAVRAAYPIAGTLRLVALAVSLPILVQVYRQRRPTSD
jgi:hypothetical protein